MLAVFECVALAVRDKGLRGLTELVPGGPYIFEVAQHAYKMLRERQKAAELREEIAKVAAASAEEAKKMAEQVAREVVNQGPIEDRLTLELYLTQMPGAVRQSLKRADDPTGKTVPPDFAVDEAEDLVKMLPARVPHFRPGGDLPGRPGWRLEELLGAGGFGEVWLARHSFLPHPRAVKFCTDAKVRAKLTSHEGRVIARVMEQGTHPNVVPLLDAVLDGETPWLMYEFVGGGNLTDLIHRWQALPEGQRESLAVLALKQLAVAVGTFHRLAPSIVHRDLKPANILFHVENRNGSGQSEEFRLRITDFGIGGVAVDYLRTNAAGMSMMTGWLETSLRGSYTPLYASPQQSRGAKPDPRDDVHALGVIAFQMLTGKLTEAPGTRFERELKRRNVSDTLVDLIGDCVDTEPNGRPKDAVELAERLGKLKEPVTQVLTPKAPVPEKKGEKTPPTAPATQTGAAASGNGTTPKAPVLSEKGALEGKSAPVTIVAHAVPAEPEKWLIPIRGVWFSRTGANADAPWIASSVKLPGEIVAKPGEAYRLTLNPDTTGDDDLAKLKALSRLPGLEAIDLSGCVRVTDTGIMHLANLRGLKAVGLADTQVTDSGVTLLLTRFPDLEAVGLAGAANVSQTVVPYLARLRKLKLLALPPRADTIDVRVEFTKRRPACQLV
ncbi:Serine/threonine-protein kinase Pkn1 [Gemmata sp. SH-PL17]|uniref:protein kinase domain-containing protein n=1 Tax=Gemmata sp. SH-PL17 TaxID=1630693 RepID=UPI00078E05C1|nr:protein kinase [Gemmata sp. SH-PL17]AMV27965.1 Serine/threonine-protein kinase Pkn1 [Gemmata sp. SH-PL17]